MTTLDDDQEQLRSNLELIGRENINDLEAVLSLVGHYEVEGFHRVPDNCPAEFTWDYEKGAKPQLDKLYEKAKKAQWNAQTDLDWSIEVDQEKVVMANAEANPGQMQWDPAALVGTALETWDDKRFLQFGIENQNWLLSQFMHGEQGALLCTAKIVETVPWIDAKYYAATQVMDEARHVEVFSKYLDEKLSGHYPMNAHLGLLLDDIVADSRWDMTYLGMQIMVEGLALAAFGFIHMMTTEPLLKKLLRYVMADEARHVAFGVLSLQEYYKELTAAELRERQEFAFEAAIRMKDRMAMQEVWERMEVRRPTWSRSCRWRPSGTTSRSSCSPRSCRTSGSSGSSTRPTGGCVRSSPKWGPSRSSISPTPPRTRTPSPTARPPIARSPERAASLVA